MKFGVEVSAVMGTMAEVREAWRRVEELGFDAISGQDHFYTLRSPTAPCFEALTTHAALATLSERVRVGCLVYSVGYRHPAVMANALATIDHLSGGRLDVGFGAGWLEAEYQAYGIPFEAPGVRLRRLDEYVRVTRLLWTEDLADFDGEFYRLRAARCDPKPLQARPPIWIGAKQPRALELAGRLADGWNAEFVSLEEFRRAAAVVRGAAPTPAGLTIGASLPLVAGPRPVDEVMRERFGAAAERMMPAVLHGSADSIVEQIGQYGTAGADWIVVTIRPPFDFEELELFATKVMPQLR
jgi:alkanesulfonate monooxygenase SsuD/methylene tetrahydromethanopterin reductase-like flavin-dependent oxidoreductase (luciferase family)